MHPHPTFPPTRQLSLTELPEPLPETTFVVVDLETTGSRKQGAGITEIGAVKTRGTEILGEFSTLVNPQHPIPPFITLLTGITEAMVADAPPIASVLPSFLDFAHGHVLVAHNAPFDIGFLKAVCADNGFDWPNPPVLDTVPLARRLFPRPEVGNHKLGTLAQHLGLAQQPTHRALEDAHATAGVLRALIDRAQERGAHTVAELRALHSSSSTTQHQARSRIDLTHLPEQPGVYVFEDADGTALYIGKSGNIRSRVRTYFTQAEKRRHIRQMLGFAHHVRPIVCGTTLEAEIRELRLLAEHEPAYNRRPRKPGRAVWLRRGTTLESRLVIERTSNPLARPPRDTPTGCLGPYGSIREAELARAALRQALGEDSPLAHTTDGSDLPESAVAAMNSEASRVVTPLTHRIETLAAEQRYEEAARVRDRLAAYLRGALRSQRLRVLAACPHLVAARRTASRHTTESGGCATWELVVVRFGRLAASGALPPEADPPAFLRATVATAETVTGGPGPTPAASAEEMERILAWLDQPSIRLVELTGTWACPVDGAERHRNLTDWHRGEHPAE